ncbi:MAG TPA: glycosyltransferase family 61 protein [Bdellovibrionota bacterium]|nr:glycosyltransferase family 61 protein [Bdellovibrionota bacterium]
MNRRELFEGRKYDVRFFGDAETISGTHATWKKIGLERPFYWERLFQKPLTLHRPFFVVLPRGELVGKKAVALDPSGNILLESTVFQMEYFRKTYDARFILRRRRIEAIEFPFPAISLVSWHERSYGHWTGEALARFLAYPEVEKAFGRDVRVVISGTPYPFQRDTLTELFGIRPEQFLPWAYTRAVFKKLIVPGYRHRRDAETMNSDVNSLEAYRELHRRSKAIPVTGTFPKNFIINRQPIHGRSILNIDHLHDALSDLDFTVLDTEGMPFRDEVGLFRNAEKVVLVHGSAFPNLIYSDHARVIDLLPGGFEWDQSQLFFYQISRALGLIHHVVPIGPIKTRDNVRLTSEEIGRIRKACAEI